MKATYRLSIEIVGEHDLSQLLDALHASIDDICGHIEATGSHVEGDQDDIEQSACVEEVSRG